MRFTKLEIEGFGSIGNRVDFRLDKEGINLIKGKNGSGKTTIFNAFAWCLYGANLKGVTNGKISTKKERRPSTFRGTHVSVGIEIGSETYIISRHLKYKGTMFGIMGNNSLMVHHKQEGVYHMVTDELFKRDQQAFINRLIGMDYRVFVNSVLFGQRMSRLVSASGSEKRAIFEELFDTGYTALAKNEAKLQYDNVILEIKDIEKDIEVLKSKQAYIQSQYNKSKQVSEGFEGNKQKSIQDLERRIRELEDTKVTLDLKLSETEGELAVASSHLHKNKELLSNFDTSELSKTRESLEVEQNNLRSIQDSLRTESSKLRSVLDDLSNIENKATSLKNIKDREYSSLSTNITKEERALDQVNTTCHACGKPIDPSKIDSVKLRISTNISSLKKEQSDIVTEYIFQIKNLDLKKRDLLSTKKDLEMSIEDIKSSLNAKKDLISNLQDKELDQSKGISELEQKIYKLESLKDSLTRTQANTQARIEDNSKSINQAKLDLESAINLTPPTIDFESMLQEIKGIEDSLLDLGTKHDSLVDKSNRLKFWASKGFSSTGMSSYIFGVRLDELNHYIHKYCSRVGLSIEMGIDLDKSSKPIYTKVIQSDGTVLDHKELSGGEQQLVDVCIAFGTHEMVSKSLPLLILDEVFENLDPANITKVFDFVRLKVEEGKNIFLITHQQDLDFTYTKVIEVSKVNNLTQVR